MMWGKLYGDLIIAGRYEYDFVVNRRPDLKIEIYAYLTEQNRTDLITEATA